MISLSVVTNGPVAKAGFILNLFIVNGTNVPKKEANKIKQLKITTTTRIFYKCWISLEKVNYNKNKIQ